MPDESAVLNGDMPTGPRLGRALGRLDDERRNLASLCRPLLDATLPGDTALLAEVQIATAHVRTAMVALVRALALVNEAGGAGR